MAVSAVYDLLDALVTNWAAVVPSGATVFDSHLDTDDVPESFVIVGIPDPTDDSASTSATAVQSFEGAGGSRPRNEDGEILCVAQASNGDGDASAARASLKAIMTAIEGQVQTNYTQGVSSVLWTSYGTTTELIQDRDEFGALAMQTFSIRYRAYLSA